MKQWSKNFEKCAYAVADPGGPEGPAPLLLDQTEAQGAEKDFF